MANDDWVCGYFKSLVPVEKLREVRLIYDMRVARGRCYWHPQNQDYGVIELNAARVVCPMEGFLIALHEGGHLASGYRRTDENYSYNEGKAWDWARAKAMRWIPKTRYRRAYEAVVDLCIACTITDCEDCPQPDLDVLKQALGDPYLAPIREGLGGAVAVKKRLMGATLNEARLRFGKRIFSQEPFLVRVH